MNCGYVHEGPTPPDICPVCGAPAERFEPYREKPSARVSAKEAETIVVIGEVKAVFKKVDPDEPMSFTAWKGDIDVTLPAAVKANMKMKSDRGDVYTDFDFQIVRDPKEGFEFKNKRGGRIILSEDIPTPPEPPIIVSRSGGTTDLTLTLEKGKTSEVKAISFDKAIYAKVNGGGPVYQFKNINRDIMIRKAK